jgi:cytochrome P450
MTTGTETSSPTAGPSRGSGTTTVKLLTRAFVQDPYPALRELRDGPQPAVPILRNGFRQWVVTRYDDVRNVLSDHGFERDVGRRLREKQATLIQPERAALMPPAVRRGVIDRDGADHARLRGVIADDLSLSKMTSLQPRIAALVDERLGRLPQGEPVDLVGQFTRPLSAHVVGELVGLPVDERDEFVGWEMSILTGTSKAEIETAGKLMYEFCCRMAALKRSQPSDDLLTRLVRAEQEGKLGEDEVVSTLANLLIGGTEPSTAIGTGIALLLTHPGARALAFDGARLTPSCVDEILRYESPFRLLGPRFASKELPLEGVTIPAGELIALCSAAANRDPRRFPDPDTFDVTRRPNPHLGFGHGPHHCLGVHLGRLETTLALERFFARFPDSSLVTPWEELRWRPGPYQRRLDTLPVILGSERDVNLQ